VTSAKQLSQGLRYLHGRTSYGDSVDDEWLIVFILRELSKQFPKLWIKVVDTDGEFLLIEAANALPRWLNPEIADNRVCSLKTRSCSRNLISLGLD
jgi:SGT1 protein